MKNIYFKNIKKKYNIWWYLINKMDDIILIIDVKISSTSKAFHVLLLIIGSVDTERKQKEPYITTTFIKKTLDFR